MLDRSPFSFRLIAFAAFIVLLFYPESIWSASFQLSFAAVTSLIWAAEITKPYWTKWREDGGFLTNFLLWLGASIMTSFVVAIVTSPLTSFHFQQIAVYSVVANALAIPVTGILVMPMMMVTFFTLPFGLEHIPLTLMGLGVEWVMAIANMVAHWPYAVWTTSNWSFIALCFFIFSGLVLFLGLGRFRYFAGVLLIIGIIFIIFTPQPRLHISQTGKEIVLNFDDKAIVANKRADKFMTITALKYIDQKDPIIVPREGRVDIDSQNKIICGGGACRYDLDFIKLTTGRNMGALIEDCAWANVVVTSEKFSNNSCKAKIFDLRTLRRSGAVAIYKNGEIKTVAQQQGDRPWTTNNRRGVWLNREPVNDKFEQETPIRPESARGQD